MSGRFEIIGSSDDLGECRVFALALVFFAAGCTSSASPKFCEKIGWQAAVQMAVDQKHRMLARSLPSDALSFASDVGLPAEGHGYAGVVGFKGKDGRTLIALIEEDCYVGWSER